MAEKKSLNPATAKATIYRGKIAIIKINQKMDENQTNGNGSEGVQLVSDCFAKMVESGIFLHGN